MMGHEDFPNLKITLRKCLGRLTSSQFQKLKTSLLSPEEIDDLSGPSKPEFVEDLERWGKLAQALEEVYKQWPDLCPPERGRGKIGRGNRNIALPFVNREIERKQILASFEDGTFYWIIDAPAGYGKTALLHSIEETHCREGWPCCYIAIPREVKKVDIKQIASWVAEGFKCAQRFYPQEEMEPQEMGRSLAGCLLEMTKGESFLGVVLLFLDNVESLAVDTLANLESFIEGVYLGLDETEFFRGGHWIVFLAGRGIHEGMLSRIKAKRLTLSPFEFEVVQQTVARCAREAGVSLKKEVSSRIAADLMYLTGGYPEYMAKIVESLWEGNFAISLKREEPEKYLREVIEVVDEIRDTFPNDLGKTWEAISVFRRYDMRLLDLLIGENLILWFGKGGQLEEALDETHLVERKKGFWQDAIARRLALLRLLTKDFPRFRELSQVGVRFYREYLCSPTYRHPEILAVEWLYQEIQYAYYVRKMDGKALEDTILKVSSETVECLIEKGKEYPQELVRDFLEVLREDWELEFMFNYFAWEPRVKTKSDIHWSAPKFYGKGEAPYRRLQKRIESVLGKLR